MFPTHNLRLYLILVFVSMDGKQKEHVLPKREIGRGEENPVHATRWSRPSARHAAYNRRSPRWSRPRAQGGKRVESCSHVQEGKRVESNRVAHKKKLGPTA